VNNLKWGITAAIFAFVVSVFLGIIFEVAVIHIFLRTIIFTVVFFGLGFGLRLIINNYLPEVFSEEVGDEAYGHSRAEHETNQAAAGIILDNTGEYAVPELFKTPGDPEQMGNIEDLISGISNFRGSASPHAQSKGIDVGTEAGYNSPREDFSLGLPDEIPFADDEYQESGYQEDADEDALQERQVFTPAFGNDGDGMGGLPDLDMMARAFSFGGGGAPAQGPAASAAPPPSASAFVPTVISEPMMPEAPSSSPYKGNKPEPMKGDFKPKELAEGIRAVLSKDNK